eukprot:509198-Amphidinium_carterae.1
MSSLWGVLEACSWADVAMTCVISASHVASLYYPIAVLREHRCIDSQLVCVHDHDEEGDDWVTCCNR